MPYLSVGPLGLMLHVTARVLSSGALIPVSHRGFSVADPTAVGSLLSIGVGRVHRLLGKVVEEEEALREFTRDIDSKPLEALIRSEFLEVDRLLAGYGRVYHRLLVDHGLLEHEARTVLLGLRHDTLTVLGDHLAKLIASELMEESRVKVATLAELVYIAYKAGLVDKGEYESLSRVLTRGSSLWGITPAGLTELGRYFLLELRWGCWYDDSRGAC